MLREFKNAYKNLNKEQKTAVDAIEGPVMVVASPGTGKTQVLTLRIANILAKTDTAPENILALTFTEAAAANMRRRLSKLIGSAAYKVIIETFHSFCNNVIKDYPEYFPQIVGSTNITEVEATEILKTIIEKMPLSALRPWGDPLYYIRDILKKIEELKREGLNPTEFLKIINDTKINTKTAAETLKANKQVLKNKELQKIYAEYQKVLNRKRLYDYSDMIMEVLKELKKGKLNPARQQGGDLKLILQEEHQFILVDEHQDSNMAQNKILELLCDFHKSPNIFIVGDEKQAIFRFQGASIENFNYFRKLYPKAKIIELSYNYRSDQHILDAAESVIKSVKSLKSIKLEAGEKIKIAEFSNIVAETFFVALDIKKVIAGGAKPEEIAVLYRNNKDAFPMAKALEREGVRHSIESDQDLFSEKYVRKFLTLLWAINDYGNDERLVAALHIEELGLEPLDIYKLMRESHKKKMTIYDLISEKPKFKKLSWLLRNWARKARTEHLTEFLENVLRQSAILESMIREQGTESFHGIERLFTEAKRIAGNMSGALLHDFTKYLNIVQNHKIFIKRPANAIKEGSVRLLTVHRTKGLEFEKVYIVNAAENSFGPKSNRDPLPLLIPFGGNSTLDDERRLFYVAITRAKKSMTMSYSNSNNDGKEILPSPFIGEIRKDRIEMIDTGRFEEKISKNPVIFRERKEKGFRRIDEAFMKEIFESQPLSVSALNNYLDCPWKYFYRNLLRIPSMPERYQLYGTAMHAAVQDLWNALGSREVGEKFLIQSYRKHIAELGVLSTIERKEAEKRGAAALKGWFAWARPEVNNPIITEFNIKACLPARQGITSGNNILLSGKLDKVEFIGDKKVEVTDYKTGKQRSRNYIEGNTKDSNGDMKRQLVFYKFILDLHSGIKMERGIIEFLEPATEVEPRYKREEFEIMGNEVEDLKKLITKTASDITSLSFWNKKCNNKDCKYCGYRNLLEK